MTNYPYYILTYFDAGILHKMFHGKKFKTYNTCKEAFKKYKEQSKIKGNKQFLLIEYSGQYEAKIINVLHEDNNAIHYITNPILY